MGGYDKDLFWKKMEELEGMFETDLRGSDAYWSLISDIASMIPNVTRVPESSSENIECELPLTMDENEPLSEKYFDPNYRSDSEDLDRTIYESSSDDYYYSDNNDDSDYRDSDEDDIENNEGYEIFVDGEFPKYQSYRIEINRPDVYDVDQDRVILGKRNADCIDLEKPLAKRRYFF